MSEPDEFADIRERLKAFDSVSVKKTGGLHAIQVGYHSGARADGQSLAEDMAKLAAPKAKPEPEAFPEIEQTKGFKSPPYIRRKQFVVQQDTSKIDAARAEAARPLPTDLGERMGDYGVVGEEAVTVENLLSELAGGEAAAAEMIRKLSERRRREFTELLNVEKAELRRESRASGVDNPRAESIDRLLNLLAMRGA